MQAFKTILATGVPFFYSSKGAAYGLDGTRNTFLGVYGGLFVAWIVLQIASVGQRGVAMIGWTMYMAYALHTALVRHCIRSKRVRSLASIRYDVVDVSALEKRCVS